MKHEAIVKNRYPNASLEPQANGTFCVWDIPQYKAIAKDYSRKLLGFAEFKELAWKDAAETIRKMECGPSEPRATGTEAQVCRDIAERQQKGIAKYGITVDKNPLSLKQWLQHAYEECLDQAVYLKRAMKEIK